MDNLTAFLANPIVGFIGYVLSVIAAIIAITQTFAKQQALRAIDELNIQITSVKEENSNLKISINKTENNNNVAQGEKSQYFQDNSGPVKIDNRG
jgi:cell division protein FtsL